MCECKNCGNKFDDSLSHSELTICPRCGLDADTFIEWVGVQPLEYNHEDYCGFSCDQIDLDN